LVRKVLGLNNFGMKKILLVIISLAIGIPLVIWLYEKFGLDRATVALSILRLWQVLILFFLTGINIYIWVVRWQLVLKALGYRICFRDLIEAQLGERAVSYLTPGIHYGGEVVRVFILGKKKKIPLTDITCSVILDRLMEVSGFCIFLFLGASELVFRGNYIWASFLVILGIFILLILTLVFKLVGLKKILIFLPDFFV